MDRYAFGHPGLSRRNVAGHGGGIDNQAFRNALRGNEQPRALIQGGTLPTADQSRRLYLDHNYFYDRLNDFTDDTGHVTEDQAKLDRIELPIEATILLMSRLDADGTGNGVSSPAAVGTVAIEWTVDEAAEDATYYPTSTTRKPTLTRAYIAAAMRATANNGDDNCPTTHGGARQANNPNAGYFRAGNVLPPFATAIAGNVVTTPAYQGGNLKRGKAGVLFRGSTIAGDNYRITAKISLRGLPNRVALQDAHTAVRNDAEWDEILLAKTGRMTLWRQHRIAAVVNWPAPNQAINWGEIAAEYAKAYCELDHAHAQTLSAANLRATQHSSSTFEQAVALIIGASLRTDNNPNNVVWNNNSLFHTNYTPPAQGQTETATRYIQRVKADAKGKLSLNFLQMYATAVSIFIAERGAIIIHGRRGRPCGVGARPHGARDATRDSTRGEDWTGSKPDPRLRAGHSIWSS